MHNSNSNADQVADNKEDPRAPLLAEDQKVERKKKKFKFPDTELTVIGYGSTTTGYRDSQNNLIQAPVAKGSLFSNNNYQQLVDEASEKKPKLNTQKDFDYLGATSELSLLLPELHLTKSKMKQLFFPLLIGSCSPYFNFDLSNDFTKQAFPGETGVQGTASAFAYAVNGGINMRTLYMVGAFFYSLYCARQANLPISGWKILFGLIFTGWASIANLKVIIDTNNKEWNIAETIWFSFCAMTTQTALTARGVLTYLITDPIHIQRSAQAIRLAVLRKLNEYLTVPLADADLVQMSKRELIKEHKLYYPKLILKTLSIAASFIYACSFVASSAEQWLPWITADKKPGVGPQIGSIFLSLPAGIAKWGLLSRAVIRFYDQFFDHWSTPYIPRDEQAASRSRLCSYATLAILGAMLSSVGMGAMSLTSAAGMVMNYLPALLNLSLTPDPVEVEYTPDQLGGFYADALIACAGVNMGDIYSLLLSCSFMAIATIQYLFNLQAYNEKRFGKNRDQTIYNAMTEICTRSDRHILRFYREEKPVLNSDDEQQNNAAPPADLAYYMLKDKQNNLVQKADEGIDAAEKDVEGKHYRVNGHFTDLLKQIHTFFKESDASVDLEKGAVRGQDAEESKQTDASQSAQPDPYQQRRHVERHPSHFSLSSSFGGGITS